MTLITLLAGVPLLALFVAGQTRAAEPVMPLGLFASRERVGAYAARFLFTGALVSSTFFMTQYLQGVTGYTPLEAAFAFLPQMLVVLATAVAVPRLTRRLGNARLLLGGIGVMLVGMAWLSRVSVDTPYVTGIASAMVVVGIGQGLGLSTLTNAGMAGVATEDAGAAGGVVNVAHHLGGAIGLGVLVTVFAAAGSGAVVPRELLAERVSAALTGAAVLLALALLVAVILRPRQAAAPVAETVVA